MAKEAEILEIYKIFVDTITANEQRRQKINSVFITLSATGIAAAGAIEDLDPIYVAVPGLLVGLIWFAQVRFLKRLATAKFQVIEQLEERLSYRPFAEEWKFFKGSDETPFSSFRFGLSGLEMIVPLVLLLGCSLYLIHRWICHLSGW